MFSLKNQKYLREIKIKHPIKNAKRELHHQKEREIKNLKGLLLNLKKLKQILNVQMNCLLAGKANLAKILSFFT